MCQLYAAVSMNTINGNERAVTTPNFGVYTGSNLNAQGVMRDEARLFDSRGQRSAYSCRV
jgi:hypothetical protein